MLTDNVGRPIGYLGDDQSNCTTLYSVNGVVLGRYMINEDRTYDASGWPIGRGNQLMRLLPR